MTLYRRRPETVEAFIAPDDTIFIADKGGKPRRVRSGDYIVKASDGSVFTMSPEDFRAEYESVPLSTFIPWNYPYTYQINWPYYANNNAGGAYTVPVQSYYFDTSTNAVLRDEGK